MAGSCNADLLCGSDESVRFEAHVLWWRSGVIAGTEGEPELDRTGRESIAVFLERTGLPDSTASNRTTLGSLKRARV